MNALLTKQNNLVFLIAGQIFYKKNWEGKSIKANSNNIVEIYDINTKSTIRLNTKLIYNKYDINSKGLIV